MSLITITEPPFYKLGSTWKFLLTRQNPDESPVDLGGLTVRAMFREKSVTGTAKATLTEGAGITVTAEDGQALLTVSAETSATFSPNSWVYFDVEMVNEDDDDTWQSDTYRFKTEAEVTV